MSQAVPAARKPAVPTIPLGQIAPWVAFFVLVALIVLFFVGADQSVLGIPGGDAIHEWVHDGRHLLGFPCH
jgi:hypothetical protein